MDQEQGPPRRLNERTGVHKCIRCLREVPADVYFVNDFVCEECVQAEEETDSPKAASDE